MLLERAVAAMEGDRRRIGELEERVGELGQQLAAVLAAVKGGGNAPGDGFRKVRAGYQRRYDDVVTREPAEDDKEVYGAAWPLVEEWRELWAGHPPQGKGLAWTVRRQRILELEVTMLDQHGLTLPPETAPLGGLDRREQWSWRDRELARVRRRRARLELLHRARRALTLGRWQ